MAMLPAALLKQLPPAEAKIAFGVAAGMLVVVLAVLSFQRAGIWRDSIILWSDAYRKTPLSAQTAHFLGRAYRDAGEYQQALPYYQQALNFLPNDPLILLNLADLHLRLQQMNAAAALVARMRIKLPADDLRVLLIEGDYALYAGDLARAEAFLTQALRREPGHPDVLFKLGKVYARMDRLGGARSALLQALKNGNHDPEVYYELACVETARGALDDAVGYVHSAIQRGLPAPIRLGTDNRLRPLWGRAEFRQLLAGG
jgi:tetratricopeptide (TPR) repeat protein